MTQYSALSNVPQMIAQTVHKREQKFLKKISKNTLNFMMKGFKNMSLINFCLDILIESLKFINIFKGDANA